MKLRVILGVFCLVIIGIGAALSNVSRHQRIDSEIRIGALLCLSGECSEWGTNTLQGMQLAVEEINKQGGVKGNKVKLVVEDSRETNPGDVISVFRHLVGTEGVKYIVGPSWTPGGLSLAPVASRSKVTVISPTVGVKDFNYAGENLFNIWPHDEDGTRFLARHAYSQGVRKMSVLASQQPWESEQGQVFRSEFEKLGGRVLAYEEPLAAEANLRGEVQRILAGEPEGVFLSNFAHMAEAAKLLREMNFRGIKFSALMDQTRIDAAQGALNDVIFAMDVSAEKSFVQSFEKLFGMRPGVGADKGYDSVKLIVKALGAAAEKDADINQKLGEIKNYQGASGEISFLKSRDIYRIPELWKIANGQYQKL
jgi:branched-chain amino acid transport system substrate-binding protein